MVEKKADQLFEGNEVLVIEFFVRDDEGYIIVGGNNRRIQVYSIRTGLLEKQMDGHEDSVTCMVIDENILITGSDDQTIRLWNLESFSYSGLVGNKD